MKKFRIPRKKKKQIPKGLYCYELRSGFKLLNSGRWGVEVKPCPFLGEIKIGEIPVNHKPKWMDKEYIDEFSNEKIEWCCLVKMEVDDQCKSCGLKYGFK